MLVSHLCSLCWDANFVVLIHANWKNASTCQPGAPALPHYIPPIALALASHQSDATTLICPRFPTRPTAWPPVFPTLWRALPEIGSGERPSPPLTWYTQLAPSLTSSRLLIPSLLHPTCYIGYIHVHHVHNICHVHVHHFPVHYVHHVHVHHDHIHVNPIWNITKLLRTLVYLAVPYLLSFVSTLNM